MPDRPPPGGVALHEAGRSCGHSGHFASEVEFSKGYRYFASVIKFAKCGSAAKVGIRRVGIAVKTAHGARFPGPGARRPRGIAARTGPAPPPLSNETHWDRKPPIGVGNLPTPMHRNLPQCGKARHVAYPNALLPTPMRAHARPLRFRRPGSCGLHCESGREWSEMRLSYAVFDGLRAGVVRNASGFDGFGWIRVDSVRLRRILDHMPAKPPLPPETQTRFGPPNRWGTGPLGHRAGTGRVEAAARGKHPHRAGTGGGVEATPTCGRRPPPAQAPTRLLVVEAATTRGRRPPPLHLGAPVRPAP